jgi:hypothetical protein
MATDINAFVQFSDGTFAVLRKEGATAEAVTSLPTGGNGLAQVSSVEIGQAYTGKTAVAASIAVQTDSAQTGLFSYGYFLGPDGKIVCPVQGGGYSSTGLPKLAKPVKMTTGLTLQACFDTQADAVALAALAVYCACGTSDVFFVKAVDATKTAMVNKDGSSIGQALTDKKITKVYATYSATNGLNDNGDGNSGFYIESADGQLKGMYPPSCSLSPEAMIPYIDLAIPVHINQNDTLSVMAGV